MTPDSSRFGLTKTTGRGYEGDVHLATQATLWPTPNASDHKGASQPPGRRPTCDDDLPSRVALWPSPQARDGRDGRISPATVAKTAHARPLNEFAVTMWSTPRASDGAKGGPNMSFGAGGTPLPTQAVAMWATPCTTDDRRGSVMPEKSRSRKKGQPKILNYGAAEFMDSLPSPQAPPTSTPGDRSSPIIPTSPPREPRRVKTRLNPEFVTWLMGWPSGWTACACSATEWSLWSRRMRGCLSRLHSGRADEPA